MIAIVHGFTGNGSRWLVNHVPHRTGARLDPKQLAHARIPFYDREVAAVLNAYRAAVDADGMDPDQELGSLLHLHHARMIGVDLASERHCLRLARAVALTDLIGATS